MMNINLYSMARYSIFLLFLSGAVYSQDTLRVNIFKTQPYVFEDKIITVSKGTDGEQLNHSIENDNVLILKSKIGINDFVPTTLYVKTEKGYHYNFLVEYAQKIAIGLKQIPLDRAAIKPVKTMSNSIEKHAVNTGNLGKTLKDKRRLKRHYARFDSVYLRFINHYYADQEVYYKIEVDNKSSFDYLIEYFKFFVATTTNKQKESNSRTLLKPGVDYEIMHAQEGIGPQNTGTFVFKFKKFSLNKEQRFLIQLKEKNGGRDLFLTINSRLINQPLTLL